MSVSSSRLLESRQASVPQGVGTMHPVFAAKAENAEIWDVEGNRYLDLASGIAVTNTGHNHPRIRAALSEQLEHFSHVCFQVTPYESYVRLAQRINEIAPGPTPKKTIFLTTGAEAVENAIKIARAHTGRPGVIAFSGGFHGRTMMGMALTGKVAPYKTGFGPFPGEVFHAPFPAEMLGVSSKDALDALDRLFKADIDPSRVAAIIIEPIQGEGGFYVAPDDFLQALRSVCDEHGILLIADEIQSGFARTGKMFAIEHANVEPDLMTIAKAMAGGVPISGVVGKADIMDSAKPGGLGGTYGGSPLGCAAGLAVLDIIEDEQLCERAVAIGDAFQSALNECRQSDFGIGEVRGRGAMVALELVQPDDPAQPAPERTAELVRLGREHGLILLSCGVRGNVLRLLPPLTMPNDQVDEALGLLKSILKATAT